MTQQRKRPYIVGLLIILILICLCLTGVYLLQHSGNDPLSLHTSPEPEKNPTPSVPTNQTPDLSELAFSIDGHTTILPDMDIYDYKFRQQYGPLLSLHESVQKFHLVTFDTPVSRFDDVIALDFTIYGEPHHRILKKSGTSPDPDIVTYQGRINKSDEATTFFITFGPGNAVTTDFLWNGTQIEVKTVQTSSYAENTTHPLHAVYAYPSMQELFAQNPGMEETIRKMNDPAMWETRYKLYLTLSQGRENEENAVIIHLGEEDFKQVPELQEFAKDRRAVIHVSKETYTQKIEPQYTKGIVEVNGNYYYLWATEDPVFLG